MLAWIALIAGIVALLLLDLLLLHRDAEVVSIRNAILSTAGFVAVSLAFALYLALAESHHLAGQFLAGYLLELSLSLDNVFVWALIFSAFTIPREFQRRILFYGIFGALVLRGAFVAAGSQLLNRFDWIVYFFGVLLLWSGIRMLRDRGEERDPRQMAIVRHFKRRVPTTNGLAGAHLFVRSSRLPADKRPDRPPLLGIWYATPLLLVLAVIEFSDIVFAVDSIPAIFGVTREPFIVFSATMLALVGLRSMYFLLEGARNRFVYLDIGLAVILMFIGIKFMVTELVEIGVGISLAVIAVVMGVAIGASLLRDAGDQRA